MSTSQAFSSLSQSSRHLLCFFCNFFSSLFVYVTAMFFFSLLLHHAAALSTATTHPLCAHCAAHSVNSHCCLCSSCDCYFLSTCAKLNNKSFGLKRKQNQSERKIAKATILTKIKKEKRREIENLLQNFFDEEEDDERISCQRYVSIKIEY